MGRSLARGGIFAAVLLIGAGASAQETPVRNQAIRALGPMAEQLQNRVGAWCVNARLQLTPQARPVRIQAVAEGRLIGGRWLVTELRGAEMGGAGFHGLGVNGFDPATGRYTGYWIDNTRGYAVPVTGDFDASTNVFRTESTERRADGTSITVLSETRTISPGFERVTFTAPDARGRPYERMVLEYRRPPATGSGRRDCPRS